MIHNFYIFNRIGTCLYEKEWNHIELTIDDRKNELDHINRDEKCRLIFGLIFSLKEFLPKMSPTPLKNGILYYKTDSYTCHVYESPTGLKFILIADNNTEDQYLSLQYIYINIFVEYVIKNPLSSVTNSAKSKEKIKCKLFNYHLNQYLHGLSCFK